MRNKLFLLSLFILSSVFAFAQSDKARNILDKTASAIRNAGDLSADFTAYSNSGNMTGTIYIHKSMFYLQSNNVRCWYDGKNLWTYRKNMNEVNITTPTVAEQQNINPYIFINIYKKGYAYAVKEVSYNGNLCYELTLTATSNANKIKTMLILVNKKNYYPLKVKMQRAKNDIEINILNCKTKQKFKESTFKFNQSDFPHAEIIDLR